MHNDSLFMTPTYHIVSHTHWDREWYRSFEEFRSMLVSMVDDLLELLRRDHRYRHFMLDGQTSVLEDYLEVRPEREGEIRRLVAEGRLVIGPWYVLPDEFLVSAEATVRNLLRGLRVSRAFGGGMTVGYIPDSFGHIAMMPALLSGFGIDTAVLYRGFGGEPDQRTSEYSWVAPDGSRCLLSHLFRHGYSAGYFHQDSDEEIVRRFAELMADLDGRATTTHRLLLNGGDHHWPDPRLPEIITLLQRTFPGTIIHSTLPAYIEAVKREVGEVPEVRGELRFGYRYAFVVMGGVYSSRIYLKQANWRCQNLLQRYAEPLNALALTQGMASRLPLLRHAWKTLMQNHPHDSICGCSVDPVHRDMMARFAAVEDIGRAVVTSSLEHVVPRDDRAAHDDRYLFFFNPSPWRRSDIAGADLRFYLQDIVVGLNPDVTVAKKLPPVAGFALVDGHGREIPLQIISRREEYDLTPTKYNYPKQTRADRFTVLVDARGIPPVGVAGFRVERRNRLSRYPSAVRSGKWFLENEALRVDVDARGTVTLHDRVRKRQYRGLGVMEDTGDAGDEYNYSYPPKDRRLLSTSGKTHVSLVERGPLRAALRLKTTMRVPASVTEDRKARMRAMVSMPVTVLLRLCGSSRALEILITVNNTAKDHRLRALFPSDARSTVALADSQLCVVERRQETYDLREFTIEHPARVAPMQRFVAVVGANRGLALLAEGLPEYELMTDRRSTLALTLLRCVGTLAGDHLITRPGGKAGWHHETPEAQCPGVHTFRLAVLPLGADAAENAELLNRESEHFHLPLLAVPRKNAGPLALEGSLFAVDNRRLTLSAVKESEEGGTLVVRLYNPGAIEEDGVIRFTVPLRRVRRARLDETPVDDLSVDEGNLVRLRFAPGEVQTLLVTTGP